MSFRLVAATPVIIPPPSNGTAAVQSNLGGTQPAIAPVTPLLGRLRRMGESNEILYVSNKYPPSFEELETALYVPKVSEPFYSILKRYYLTKRKIQHEENQRFGVIQANHRALRGITGVIASGCLSHPLLNPKPALEYIMNMHAKELRNTDSAIDAWIAERNNASDNRARLNERIVAENTRKVAVNERREAAARFYEANGRPDWTTARKEKWNADLTKLREAYRKWEEGFGAWQEAYQMMLREDEIWEEEIGIMMERQEGWTRWVGNWLVEEYFEEVETLNAEANEAAQEKHNEV